jgi:GNAT superfamily N-acetyltransferase
MAGNLDVLLRPARREECRTIAEFYRVSSDGVAEYVWSKRAAPGEAPIDVGTRRYARDDSPFGYRNALLAEVEGVVAGMLVAFPIEPSTGSEDDPVLAPYARLEEPNSYYLCSMAVRPEYRGRGLGSRFLAHADDEARRRAFSKLSLCVFEANHGATRLYARHGYVETRREPVVPHPLIRHTGAALLMVKTLGPGH